MISRTAALSLARVDRAVVLDAFTADQGDRTLWEPLKACADDVFVHDRTPAALCLERARGAQVLLTNKVRLDASAVAALAEDGLRFVGSVATGYDHIDVSACAARGVVVANVPKYSTNAVAQMVMAYLLHDASAVHAHAAAARDGTWQAADDFTTLGAAPLRELEGQRLVVVGRGAIGERVGALAAAFGMAVAFAKTPRDERARADERARLHVELAGADAVVLACPLVAATRALVDDAFCAALAPHALLVNAARGPIVDERALAAALSDAARAPRRAYLDVLCDEPPRDPQSASAALLGLGEARAVVTPHVAWGTLEARRRLCAIACENARAFVQDGSTPNRVDGVQ